MTSSQIAYCDVVNAIRNGRVSPNTKYMIRVKELVAKAAVSKCHTEDLFISSMIYRIFGRTHFRRYSIVKANINNHFGAHGSFAQC